jgi:outer membrane protein assembly factor BamA
MSWAQHESEMKMKTLAAVIASLVLLMTMPAISAAPPGDEAAAETSRKGGVIILPIVFYSPETHMAGGLGGILTFRRSGAGATDRPSSISFYAIYTQMKQFSVSWEPEFYFLKEAWLVKGRLQIERYPDKFWGIGPAVPDAAEEGYTPRSAMIEASFQRKVVPSANLYAGLQVRYERYRIIKTDPAGAIGRGAVTGSGGGTATGIGFILSRDSRDDLFFPRRGDYWQLSALFNAKAFGGDFAYTHMKLDARRYLPAFASHVLAFQGQIQVISGAPPFYGYAKLGSDTMLRGYYTGRFRDKVMAAVQAEYRLPLFWRIGIVGFAGLGNVAPRLGALELDHLKYSYGTGLRYRISSRETTNLRVDVAFGKNTSGIYFTAREAF